MSPSARTLRAIAEHQRSRRRRGFAVVFVAVMALLALAFAAGCSSVHDAVAPFVEDLDLYVDNVDPAPKLTATEATLPPEQQTAILTARYNRIRMLGDELKKTAHKIEEASR